MGRNNNCRTFGGISYEFDYDDRAGDCFQLMSMYRTGSLDMIRNQSIPVATAFQAKCLLKL